MKIAKITLALGALSLFSLSAGAQENARLSSDYCCGEAIALLI